MKTRLGMRMGIRTNRGCDPASDISSGVFDLACAAIIGQHAPTGEKAAAERNFDPLGGEKSGASRRKTRSLNAKTTTSATILRATFCRSAANALLQLCRWLHPYLSNYMVLICRGHVPRWNGMNSDSAKFLAYFLPKGGRLDMETAQWIARSLHLAFKGMDSGEVYDILMQQFLVAAAKYDPDYTAKVKRMVECIENHTQLAGSETIVHDRSKYKTIRVIDANRHLEFDCDRHLRFLARRSFLSPVKGKDGKISGWLRSEIWPPVPEFFQIRPIGFAHFIQTWFRYYVQQWIEKRQSELETRDGVYSYGLRGEKVPEGNRLRAGNIDGTFLREESEEMVQSRSSRSRPASTRSLADTQPADQDLDVGKLNIEWVDHTEDPLFRDLSRNERYLLGH